MNISAFRELVTIKDNSTKWLLSVRKSPFFGPLPLRPPEIALKTAWKSSPLLSLHARLKSPRKLLEFSLPVESRLFTRVFLLASFIHVMCAAPEYRTIKLKKLEFYLLSCFLRGKEQRWRILLTQKSFPGLLWRIIGFPAESVGWDLGENSLSLPFNIGCPPACSWV